GGTGPYTILWSPAPGSGQGTTTATGLTPGNYSVQITDNTGCTQSASFTITQPSALNAVLSPVNPTCNGACDGSITSAVSGGTGSINLIWSNGTNGANINGLCAGNYSVTLTDQNNCTATFSSQLTDPAAIDVIISHTDAGCGGVPGTATAIANGGTGAFSYIWFDSQFNVYPSTPTISNLLPDDYTVVVSDANGCSVAGMVTVTQGFPPSLSETHTDLLCNGNLS
ncbi:MAG TPA: SprB repeat-containing protein, partial [Flavobacteriales bacterium]|nr:SprB repeat-containing protein [Flavobacteriales bacterium]